MAQAVKKKRIRSRQFRKKEYGPSSLGKKNTVQAV